ncbi:MAG TPA: alkaline phosphatase family protein [Candidatus Acidoferrales bacterium]|jgi:phospholipase C|nr:alkaline phosphatase family protein [Candidatus Acidoferrales bacterium]
MTRTWIAGAGAALALAACSAGASRTAAPFVPAPAPAMRDAAANAIHDASFESGGFKYWKQCGTLPASIVASASHSGSHSAFEGTEAPPELNGTSALCQTVTVPRFGRLSFWSIDQTDDSLQYANQSVALLDQGGKVLTTLSETASNTTGWTKQSLDVSTYAGKKVQVQFSVHGNGYAQAFVDRWIDDVALSAGTPTPSPLPSATPVAGSPIQHVIIILQENRTFDNVFHGYPGANSATSGPTSTGGRVKMQQVPFMTTWDPSHNYSDWLNEYNNGGMNGFDREGLDYGSGAPKDFAYSYARRSDVQPYWDLAKEGVLGDDTFADHRSQSFAGHLYPIAGASGPIDAADPDYYAANNPHGGESCADPGTGQAVDIITGALDKEYTSCFDFKTIADLMDARKVSWKFYVDSSDRENYVSSFSVIKHVYNSQDFINNVVSPETAIFEDVQNGTLPAVSYVIGTFANSDHAGQNVPSSNGPRWVTSVFNAIGKSKYWKNSVVILAYDDWGGWYDHVKPKTFNAFEAGFRIPLVIDSAYAKRGYISHKPHYIGSLLHFIEANWNLGSLNRSDARSDAFDDCFNYKQNPLKYIPVNAGNPLSVLVDTDLPWYGRTPQDPSERD